jgi:hypothetical protein
MADQDDRMTALAVEAGAARAFDLSGRVAVLTGGASGIGRATAHVLAGAGATVVLGDIDEAGAQTVAKEIEARGGTASARFTDVTDPADVDGLVALPWPPTSGWTSWATSPASPCGAWWWT